MRHHPGPALLAALLLLLAACGGDVPTLAPLPADARVLAFGDSLTRGTGAREAESYPAVLARRIGRTVVNAGIPGELSAEGRARLPGVLDETRPDLLVLLHGGNDILRGRDRDALRANLRAMVDAARQRDVPVVLVGVPDRSLLSLDTAEVYRTLAERFNVPLVDEAVADILSESELRSDRIHPNAAGYRRLAAAVHDTLARSGAVAEP